MDEPSISLDVKILYGKGITGFNFFQKLLIYAAVSLFSDDPEKKLNQVQKQRTAADKEGDGSPEWNHEIQMDLKAIPLPYDDVFLRFDLYHEGVMFGDKHIGQVRVPLRDITDEAGGVVRFVSYQVKGPDGKPNGVLTFSYKLNGVGHGGSIPSGVTGYAIVDQSHHEESAELENSPPGIVTYPTLDAFDHLAPPPAISYYPAPESYYPPPPPPPPVIYPMPPGWPPGPPMHHHHHHHHHHHLWGQGPNMGDVERWKSLEERESWKKEDPYASPWTSR